MRIRIFAAILAFCFLFVFSGIFYIQVVMHEKYRVMSEENRLKVVPLKAPRGSLYDRSGEYLAKDILSFDVCVIYSQVRDLPSLARDLAPVLDLEPGERRQWLTLQ